MYNADNAKKYWKERIVGGNGELNTVLSYTEKPSVNKYYDIWEKHVILNLIGELKGKKILDIPGGIGRWTKVLSEKGGNITCVDICEEIIDLIKKKLGAPACENVDFIISDANNISFKDESFDCILCTGLFEHLPQESYLDVTEKFSRMLIKNGKIFLVINNSNSVFIRQREDNPFRLSQQLENGYYCGISNYDRIVERLKENNVKVTNIAINPSYSIIRQIYKELNYEEKQLDELFESAVNKDIRYFSNLDDFDLCLSDQIVILGEKI